MKKLMFAAAAIAAGVAVADVTSANVVGYQNIPAVNGISWIMSTIPTMGKSLEKQTIGDFKLPVDAPFLSGDSIMLEIWNSSGESEGIYSFVGNAVKEGYGLTNPGWYPWEAVAYGYVTDGDLSDNVEVPFGKGVIITSSEADTTVTFSGEVLGEKSYPLINGINWIGNATPVKIWLRDFAVPVDAPFLSGDSIMLEIWNSSGESEGIYSFVGNAVKEGYGLTNPGWYPWEAVAYGYVTDGDLANETISLDPGQLIVVTSSEEDTTVTLPDPMTVIPPKE